MVAAEAAGLDGVEEAVALDEVEAAASEESGKASAISDPAARPRHLLALLAANTSFFFVTILRLLNLINGVAGAMIIDSDGL